MELRLEPSQLHRLHGFTVVNATEELCLRWSKTVYSIVEAAKEDGPIELLRNHLKQLYPDWDHTKLKE